MWNTLYRRGTGADDGHSLIVQPIEAAVRIAAGIGIVPAAGMKGMTLELINATNCWQLGSIQGPVGMHHISRLQPILTIR